jgi:hypothetical protein
VAAKAGQAAVVEALLAAQAQAEVEAVMLGSGETALMLAAGQCQPEVVRVLLAAGAKVYARDSKGVSLLALQQIPDTLVRLAAVRQTGWMVLIRNAGVCLTQAVNAHGCYSHTQHAGCASIHKGMKSIHKRLWLHGVYYAGANALHHVCTSTVKAADKAVRQAAVLQLLMQAAAAYRTHPALADEVLTAAAADGALGQTLGGVNTLSGESLGWRGRMCGADIGMHPSPLRRCMFQWCHQGCSCVSCPGVVMLGVPTALGKTE